MKNLEQIRAKNAWSCTQDVTYAGKESGQVAKKIPALIREHGVLGTLAFALEKTSKERYANDGMKRVLDTVAMHLASHEIAYLPPEVNDAEKWLKFLTQSASSSQLREQTAEAMQYLSYFRRFAHKE
ncbi:MAG: type III-B CRISPR module-associated protein Cmr5 [Kiritimatiellia bacterium]